MALNPSTTLAEIASTTPALTRKLEHTVVGGLLEQLRALIHGYRAPAATWASTQALMEGLAERVADTPLPVHKENNHPFPAVKGLVERWMA